MIDPLSMFIVGLTIPGGKCRVPLSSPRLVLSMFQVSWRREQRTGGYRDVIGNVSPDHRPRGTNSRIYKCNNVNRFSQAKYISYDQHVLPPQSTPLDIALFRIPFIRSPQNITLDEVQHQSKVGSVGFRLGSSSEVKTFAYSKC